MNNRNIILLAATIITACTASTEHKGMFPDYRDVTVPYNIAPINFYYSGKGGAGSTTFSAGDYSFTVKGKNVKIPQDKWSELMNKATGSEVIVSNKNFGDWTFNVSEDPVDKYMTYRLLEPGYEVASKVQIKERDITCFSERTLSSYVNTDNSCMNCHFHNGHNSIFYLRGKKGGAILNRNGEIRKLNLKDSLMYSGTVYGELHPSGRWGVFSTNIIIPAFHTDGVYRFEVYDTKSDICITDFDNNKIILPEELNRDDIFESFPCFNADGTEIYYCSADTVKLPENIKELKYSLMKVPFNAVTGETGLPEMVWDAADHNASVCHPKISPDGKWLVYTIADYGTFPIWHRECDFEMINLNTGEIVDISAANSDFSETYHSWSSNSRWMAFASKRGDGQYGKPYLCHISEDGTVSKPFLLPQEDPHFYDKTVKSFNIPDLGMDPAPYDYEVIGELRNNMESESFSR